MKIIFIAVRGAVMSTDTPSCFTKLAGCSKSQVRRGSSECARSCVLQHSKDEQFTPVRLLLQFLSNSSFFRVFRSYFSLSPSLNKQFPRFSTSHPPKILTSITLTWWQLFLPNEQNWRYQVGFLTCSILRIPKPTCTPTFLSSLYLIEQFSTQTPQ